MSTKKDEDAAYARIQTERYANLIAACVEFAHREAVLAPVKQRTGPGKGELALREQARSAILFLNRMGILKSFVKRTEKVGGMKARNLRQNITLLVEAGVLDMPD